jgi:hypothetical protein
MGNYLKVSEAPKTKLQLKKAILNGTITVFEKDMDSDMSFRKLDSVNAIINLWDGFRYAPKYQVESNIATAYLGTSFYYKFTKAN